LTLLSKNRKDNGANQIITILSQKAEDNIFEELEWDEASDGVNCYAWAANCETPASGKPNPGTYSGHDSGRKDVLKIIDGAKIDGMIYGANSNVDDPPGMLNGFYAVALYFSGEDYHWYRRDPNTGRRSHKPGANRVKNYGPEFKVLPNFLGGISHNYGSAFNNYTFVGYFYVPEEGIQV